MHSRFYETFTNSRTGEVQSEDPRLGPLPERWRRVDEVDPVTGIPRASVFLNEENGEQTPLDPRMTLDQLQNRGVDLKKMQLV